MRNLHPVIEERILWGKEVNRGDWAFSSVSRVIGLVKRIFKRKNRKLAEIVLIRKRPRGAGPDFIRKFIVPFSSLLRVRDPYESSAFLTVRWKRLKKPPSLSLLDASRIGKKKLVNFLWCKKVEHFIGGSDVCMRRRQNDLGLYPECDGCELGYLVGRSEDSKAELKTICEKITMMVFREPPPHPVKGRFTPAERWISGEKRIGGKPLPEVFTTKIGTQGRIKNKQKGGDAFSRSEEVVTRKARKIKKKFKKTLKFKDDRLIGKGGDVTTAKLISREVKKIRKLKNVKKVDRKVAVVEPRKKVVRKVRKLKKIKRR